MNTWKAFTETMKQVSDRFGLSLDDITYIQADQARDFLQMWNYGRSFQTAYSPQELDLFYQLPEFWVYWQQLWVNQDRKLLANTSKLDILELQNAEIDMRRWYAAHHNFKGSYFTPDKTIMDAYEAHQTEANSILSTFKNLLNT
jgi:hypothetical protein